MKWTGLNDIREQYLSFFESKGHTRLPSYSLIPPQGDPSLLLINSGMAPMKNYFTGVETPPNKRVTTCQKCIRTPDIERVGKTSRHGTYFEMLGNFSFGDYFKHEATAWAWEFSTKVIGLPVDRLWVSIYEDDDEAFDIWTKEVGVAPDRMVRLGKEDNFWEHGTGPCGPCSELYFDRGEEYGCGSPDCKVGCDCDRFMEYWNLVFTQFDSDGKGNYAKLENPNIDTGMGLERLACILQGVGNLFEVDTVQNIMKHVSDIAKVTYHENEKNDVSLRVITDHIRSTTFMIGDGVVPSNVGRGYVLKRLLRRAARHGKLLGIHEPFLYKVCDTVIKENASAYPELVDKADYIRKVIKNEEESFNKTVNQGMELLHELIDKVDTMTIEGEKKLSGEDAFKLYDTFGFPIDLTKEIISERGIALDEEHFVRLMEEQKVRARTARKDISGWDNGLALELGSTPTEFVGYETLSTQAKILYILVDGEFAESIREGEEATIVLDRTSFYAESGGQVGDKGILCDGKNIFTVSDCQKLPSGHFLHIGRMTAGAISSGDDCVTHVDAKRRQAIMRNHSSCHLLQEALRRVLGNHVHQAGSMVDDTRCRFDFSHFSAMTPQEIEKTEEIVNEMILDGMGVCIKEMSMEEARQTGATALFGEKYGDTVRVVNMGEQSIELCGGTHVDNTSKVGLFKIISEASVAAGVRRIEATTGLGVLHLMDDNKKMMGEVADTLKVNNIQEIPSKVVAVSSILKEKEREIERLNGLVAGMQINSLIENAKQIGSVKLIHAQFGDMGIDAIRAMGDRVRDNAPKTVAVLSSVSDNKATIMISCGKEAVAAGVHCGKLMKELTAMVGGSGGGRPDSAMGGATEIFKIDEAIAKVPQMIEKMLTSK